ncbi:MAG TPA: cytochrome P450 [Candidatus Limnocylindrales bacterium]|nr:cytochrome P450 [Candidatus Limnocylindrales bacterium]
MGARASDAATAITPRQLGFLPTDPAFIADPYPVYRRLRDDHPILWNPDTRQWLVSRHADVNRLLRDRWLGRTYLHQATHAEFGRSAPPAWHAPFHDLNDAGMLDLEPPDHTRLRRLVLRAFTPRTVEAMRGRIQAIVDGLIDELAGSGEIDLIADYVEPLPVTVIAELLGVPAADRHLLRPWSADFCLMYEIDPGEESARKAVAASVAFGAYLRDLLTDRRRHPGSDLISALAAVVDDGDTLTETELVATCVLLLNAGHEASVNGAGNGWWTLLRHPDALARLRAQPELMDSAIEELLRYDTPSTLFERWVLEPVEVAGVELPRGAEVALLFGSANRDAAAFERPDELRLDRDPNPSLSFGAGIHYCLGAPLAKLELGVAFATLLRRVPGLELVEEPRWKPTFVLRGLEALRVRV